MHHSHPQNCQQQVQIQQVINILSIADLASYFSHLKTGQTVAMVIKSKANGEQSCVKIQLNITFQPAKKLHNTR